MQRYSFLRRIHLWLSLAIAVPLVITSLTGVLLVFGHELQAAFWPKEWTSADPSAPALPFETVLERFEAQYPGIRVNHIGKDQFEGHAWIMWLGNGAGVANVDPATGEVIRRYKGNETPYDFVRVIHRWFMAPGGAPREIARTIISVAALLLVVQLAIGIWMWAIPPRPLKRLAIPLRTGSTRLIVLRLHSVTALVLTAILVLIAVTGVTFHWHKGMERIVSAVTFTEINRPPKIEAPGHEGPRNMDLAVASALELYPDAHVAGVGPSHGNTEPVRVALDRPGFINNTIVQADPVTGEVLDVFRAEDRTAASAFIAAAYKLHVGDFLGLPVRILWMFISLAPAVYVVTGFWLYLNRTRLRRAARRAARRDGDGALSPAPRT